MYRVFGRWSAGTSRSVLQCLGSWQNKKRTQADTGRREVLGRREVFLFAVKSQRLPFNPDFVWSCFTGYLHTNIWRLLDFPVSDCLLLAHAWEMVRRYLHLLFTLIYLFSPLIWLLTWKIPLEQCSSQALPAMRVLTPPSQEKLKTTVWIYCYVQFLTG